MNFKDSFIEGITPILASRGFIYQEKIPFFTLRESGLVKVIGLDISSHSPRYAALPNVLIRSVDVARVVQAFDGDRFKGDYYFTVRTNQPDLAYLFNRPEYRIGLHVLKDDVTVQTAIKNFNSFMNDIGFSFFDRFKTLNDFDTWFNDDVLNATYDFKRGNAGGNAKEGLIAAKLNNNPRFDEIYQVWIRGLEMAAKFHTYIEPLQSLKAFLDQYQVKA